MSLDQSIARLREVVSAYTDDVALSKTVYVKGHWRTRKGKREWVDGYEYQRESIDDPGGLEKLNKKMARGYTQPYSDSIDRFYGYTNLKPAVRKEIEETADKLYKEWGIPINLDAEVVNSTIGRQAWAVTNMLNGDISFNVVALSKPDALDRIKNARENGITTLLNIGDILRHEFGHVLASNMYHDDPTLYKLLALPFHRANTHDYQADHETLVVGSKEHLAATVSSYAAEKIDEGIAESFTLGLQGVSNYWTAHVLGAFKRYRDKSKTVALSKIKKWIPPKTRVRNGKTEHVSGFWRTYNKKLDIEVPQVRVLGKGKPAPAGDMGGTDTQMFSLHHNEIMNLADNNKDRLTNTASLLKHKVVEDISVGLRERYESHPEFKKWVDEQIEEGRALKPGRSSRGGAWSEESMSPEVWRDTVLARVGLPGQMDALPNAAEERKRIEGMDDVDVLLRYKTDSLVGGWARSASMEDRSVALQYRVWQKLGDPNKPSSLFRSDNAQAYQRPRIEQLLEKEGPFIDQFIDQVYENTQKKLKENGIKEVTLYRGMIWTSWGVGDRVSPKIREAQLEGIQELEPISNPLTSWSFDWQIADDQFGASLASASISGGELGLTLSMTVPAERVWAMTYTGPGSLAESELIVLQQDGDVAHVVWSKLPTQRLSNQEIDLAQIWIPPHASKSPKGKPEFVKGHFRHVDLKHPKGLPVSPFEPGFEDPKLNEFMHSWLDRDIPFPTEGYKRVELKHEIMVNLSTRIESRMKEDNRLRDWVDGEASDPTNLVVSTVALKGLERQRPWYAQMEEEQRRIAAEIGAIGFKDPDFSAKMKPINARLLENKHQREEIPQINALSPQQKILRYRVHQYIDSWTQSSGATDVQSLAVQAVVRKRFNTEAGLLDKVPNASDTGLFNSGISISKEELADRLREDGPFIQEFVTALYENTQEELKKRGITELKLYRGMNWGVSSEEPDWVNESDSQVVPGVDFERASELRGQVHKLVFRSQKLIAQAEDIQQQIELRDMYRSSPQLFTRGEPKVPEGNVAALRAEATRLAEEAERLENERQDILRRQDLFYSPDLPNKQQQRVNSILKERAQLFMKTVAQSPEWYADERRFQEINQELSDLRSNASVPTNHGAGHSNPLTSWTTDRATAEQFGQEGVVLTMTVPVERVFSTSLTGLGSAPEYELILTGQKGDAVFFYRTADPEYDNSEDIEFSNVELAKVWVPPHPSHSKKGKLTHVKGYWKTVEDKIEVPAPTKMRAGTPVEPPTGRRSVTGSSLDVDYDLKYYFEDAQDQASLDGERGGNARDLIADEDPDNIATESEAVIRGRIKDTIVNNVSRALFKRYDVDPEFKNWVDKKLAGIHSTNIKIIKDRVIAWRRMVGRDTTDLQGLTPAQVVIRDNTNKFLQSWTLIPNIDMDEERLPYYLALHAAVAKKFGGNAEPLWERLKRRPDPAKATMAYAFVDEVYRQTQKDLEAHDIETVTIHRGLAFTDERGGWVPRAPNEIVEAFADGATQIHPVVNPITSWAFDYEWAKSFAGRHDLSLTLSMQVPRERVFSTAITGPGAFPETEVVIIGNPEDVATIKWTAPAPDDYRFSNQEIALAKTKVKAHVIHKDGKIVPVKESQRTTKGLKSLATSKSKSYTSSQPHHKERVLWLLESKNLADLPPSTMNRLMKGVKTKIEEGRDIDILDAKDMLRAIAAHDSRSDGEQKDLDQISKELTKFVYTRTGIEPRYTKPKKKEDQKQETKPAAKVKKDESVPEVPKKKQGRPPKAKPVVEEAVKAPTSQDSGAESKAEG